MRRNNKSNLVLSLNDKDYGSQQPPRASQAHGTGSFVSTSPTNQAASRSIRSISKPYLAGGLEDLLQPQNVTSPIKPTVPTPPPMLAAINNKPKVSFQSQNVNNSIIPTPPPLPPLPGDASQLPPPPPPMPEGNLFTNKPEAQLQEIKIQDESTSLSIPKFSGELLNSIRRFDNGSLKKFGDTKNTYQNSRDKLLDSIRNFNQDSLKKQKDLEQKDAHNKSTKQPTLVNELSNALDKIRQACAPSDSENDGDNHSTPNSDEWEEDIKTSPKAQEENSNEVTKSCIEDSNHHMDSGINSGEGSLEKVSNNTEEMQKPNSLFRSSSLSNLNGIEESQKLSNLSHSFSSLNL